VNHHEDSLYQEQREFIDNIIIPRRSDDVIVTSLETTLLRTVDGKKYNNIPSNNFRKLKRIFVIFAKQHQRSKEKLTVERKYTSTN